jgi:hypothetical protein
MSPSTAQRIREVCCFPRKIQIIAAEMSVDGERAVESDSSGERWLCPQRETVLDRGGAEIEMTPEMVGEISIQEAARSKCLDRDAERRRASDRITKMHFTPVGKASGYDILCGMAGRISADSIDARRILARQCRAAMASNLSVSIDAVLPPSKARMAGRSINVKDTAIDIYTYLCLSVRTHLVRSKSALHEIAQARFDFGAALVR